MSGTLGIICSDSRLDIGAVDPQDAARAAEFQRKVAPEVAQACKAEARVAQARTKVEAAQQAAFKAGVTANQQPTPANEKLRIEAQGNLKIANAELTSATQALAKIQTHLSQLRAQFVGITKSSASTPTAVRLAKGSPTTLTPSPKPQHRPSRSIAPLR